MHKALIAGLMAAASLPLMAQAPAPQPPLPPRVPMPAMAPMADKVITRSEVQAMVQSHFARMDANRDGFLAGAELTRGKDHKMGAHAMRDGGARRDDPAQAFNRLDTNRDGMLSRDEFAKGREIRIERRTEMRGAPGAGGAHTMGMPGMHQPGGMHQQGGMRGHGMGMGMMRGHMLKMADGNKDGRVSMQEATSGALQHFDKMDANRDGRVTPDERRGMRGMRMRQAG